VITEDLVLAVELRKPEALKKFFISLLENPGREINFSKLSKDLEIPRQSIEKYFPLLEMTDLVRSVEKFSKSPVRLRRGNIKCYLVDLALRNAVLRLREDILGDDTVMGMYAENLVFNAISSIEGLLSVNYYREKDSEVDFILHLGASKYWPIEVKYRNKITTHDLQVIKTIIDRYNLKGGFVISKKWDHFIVDEKIIFFPLSHFLLLFD
jgi:predicted AAA+ superfamily ATPase